MKMRCPHCSVSGRAAESLSGRKVRCPRCSNFFLVPARPDPPAPKVAGEQLRAETEMEPGTPDSEAASPGNLSEPEINRGQALDEVEVRVPAGEQDDPVGPVGQTSTAEAGIVSAESEQIPPEPDQNRGSELDPEVAVRSGEPERKGADQAYPDRFDGPDDQAEPAAVIIREDKPEPAVKAADSDEALFPDYGEDAVAWERSGAAEPESAATESVDSVEEKRLRQELEAMLAGNCSVCGKTIEDEESFSEENHLYCPDCFAADGGGGSGKVVVGTAAGAAPSAVEPPSGQASVATGLPRFRLGNDFSIIGVLREAWHLTAGIKGAVWLGIVVMLTVLFGVGAAGVFLLPNAGAPAGGIVTAWINMVLQLVGTVMSMAFIAGLMYLGVRRVAGKSFSWRLIFSGFSRLAAVAVAGMLMTLLIASGFFLLVLPGIYLLVGYSLTLPLILDQGCGPWEAMERSRKAIHSRWWQIFGLYLTMYLVYLISFIPLGLGLIWSIPMFFTLSGVLYRLLFIEEAA